MLLAPEAKCGKCLAVTAPGEYTPSVSARKYNYIAALSHREIRFVAFNSRENLRAALNWRVRFVAPGYLFPSLRKFGPVRLGIEPFHRLSETRREHFPPLPVGQQSFDLQDMTPS